MLPRYILVGCLFSAILSTRVATADVSFTAKPTITRTDASGAAEIRFAVSAATDVDVCVLDGDGRVVRHLIAGAVGVARVVPPLSPGLAQEIPWDGRDDFGQPAPPNVRVRVRIGSRPKLGKVLMEDRGLAWSPRAATVGPDGLLYVLQEHAQTKSTFIVEAYTQDGKYVRTVMPYPANLPPQRLAGLERLQLPDGRWLPRVHHFGFRDLYPLATGMRPQRLIITSRGWLVMANASRTHNAGGPFPQHVLIADTAGGIPRDSYVGPPTSAERFPYGMCWLALSPDEKWIYTSGQLARGRSDDDLSTAPHHVVYRVGWDDREPAKPFIGELNKPGDGPTHLSRPRGIDTDADGRIYVCDYANNRVAVFDADGKYVAQVDVPGPDQVVVNRKTGTFYVLTWNPPAGATGPAAAPWYPASNVKYRPDSVNVEHTIFKYPRLGAEPSARLEIRRPYCTMSLDASGAAPTLWLARTMVERNTGRQCVEKVVDRGDRLDGPVEVVGPRKLPDVYQLAASMTNDDIFVSSYSESRVVRVDGRTGEAVVLPVTGADVAVGPQGQLVVYNYVHYFKKLARLDQFDRDGKPLPFTVGGGNRIADIAANHWGHEGTGSRGLAVSPRGEQVIIGRRENEEYAVRILSADGQERYAIRGVHGPDCSPVVDLAGNVYVATAARPADEMLPEPLRNTNPPPNGYVNMYGSVVKFGPEGGQFFRAPKDPASGPWPPADADKMIKLSEPRTGDVYVRGALWVRPGFTIVPTGSFCNCYTSRFAVDYHGRVYIPDVGLFSVLMVDAANNPLARFGDYGNTDTPSNGASGPGIPLSWPVAVSVGRSGIYVSDFINRRVLRVDLHWAAEELCAPRTASR